MLSGKITSLFYRIRASVLLHTNLHTTLLGNEFDILVILIIIFKLQEPFCGLGDLEQPSKIETSIYIPCIISKINNLLRLKKSEIFDKNETQMLGKLEIGYYSMINLLFI